MNNNNAVKCPINIPALLKNISKTAISAVGNLKNI